MPPHGSHQGTRPTRRSPVRDGLAQGAHFYRVAQGRSRPMHHHGAHLTGTQACTCTRAQDA